MKSVKVKISQIKANPENPRVIKDEQFEKLVKSITEFPQMLEIRPLVVDEDLMILGGNMRLRAAQKAGLKELPVIKASELSEEQKQRFIIADNLSFGEWDWDKLANEWDAENLADWGLDVPGFDGVAAQENEHDKSHNIDNIQYALYIEFANESEMQKEYENMTRKGHVCKIIA